MKIPHPHVKKSKILLGKAGVITTNQEESPPKETTKDPYNLSNDEYYDAKSSERMIKMALGGGAIQHSTPVVELHRSVVSPPPSIRFWPAFVKRFKSKRGVH